MRGWCVAHHFQVKKSHGSIKFLQSGGWVILVDHWSTISSFCCCVSNAIESYLKKKTKKKRYDDVTMSLMASQITSRTIVDSTVYSGADQRKHQSSTSLAFVRGIHRGPVNSPHKWPVTRKMFPFDDVIMNNMANWNIWLETIWKWPSMLNDLDSGNAAMIWLVTRK